MSEMDALSKLQETLSIPTWWEDLLGQKAGDTLDYNIIDERLPRTEILAAEEIRRKFGKHVSYINHTKKWYIWDERIHSPCDGEGIVVKIVKMYFATVKKTLEYVRDSIRRDADKVANSGITDADKKSEAMLKTYDTVFKKHRDFRDRIATDAGISAVVRLLRTEFDVPVDYFDNDQRWFVCRNLVVDLDSMRDGAQWSFLPHDANRPVTRYFDADYVYNEKTINPGEWDRFLETSIPNTEMRDYFQLVISASFMGESKLRCICNLTGPPGSGKSVAVNTFFKLGKAGSGYSAMPDSRVITKVSGQNFEQDKLKSLRFSGISEPSSSEPIDDDFLKRYTGDIWVETRTLNAASTGWVPQGVIFVASNKPLRINTRDEAIVERVQMIQFPVHFEKNHPDPAKRLDATLEARLLEEESRSRILYWLLVGMAKFVVQEGRKLSPPASVTALSSSVVVEGSTALRWVQDLVANQLLTINEHEEDDKYSVTVDDAYARYSQWCMFNGEKHPLTKRFFQQDIANKYFGTSGEGSNAKFFGILPTVEYRRRFEGPATSALTPKPVTFSNGISI